MISRRRDLALGEWKLPLRRWQSEATRSWGEREPENDLWVATPGAGKTTAAARLTHALLRQGSIEQVIIVVPRDHLKAQFARSLAAVGIHLDYAFSNGFPVLSQDMHGAVVSYQQVAIEPNVYQRLNTRRTLVILDEIHHAGDGASWGDALTVAFSNATYRLALSGTPFRSDGKRIPFVMYRGDGTCEPGFNYGYEAALADGVCRQVVFPVVQGEQSWISRNGDKKTATFETKIAKDLQSERLRTHLLHDTFSSVISAAHETLARVRMDGHSNAGGLIVCMNQDHAKHMVALVERTVGIRPGLVVSEDPDSSRKIDAFANSSEPWLVAVHMVSEGVDIPRLRVGVFASNVRTELYFRQFVGRFVRLTRGMPATQKAYVYIPGDPKLVRFAKEIRLEVQTAIKRRDEIEVAAEREVGDRSPSLYEALSATMTIGSPLHGEMPNGSRTPLPFLPSAPASAAPDPAPLSRGDAKMEARRKIKMMVSVVTARFKVDSRKVYTTLKKRCGDRDISESTLYHLDERVKQLERWIEKGYYDGKR